MRPAPRRTQWRGGRSLRRRTSLHSGRDLKTPRLVVRGGGGAGGRPHCIANARAGGGGLSARPGPSEERASRRQTGHSRPWIPSGHAVCGPRLSRGRQRRAGSGSGP